MSQNQALNTYIWDSLGSEVILVQRRLFQKKVGGFETLRMSSSPVQAPVTLGRVLPILPSVDTNTNNLGLMGLRSRPNYGPLVNLGQHRTKQVWFGKCQTLGQPFLASWVDTTKSRPSGPPDRWTCPFAGKPQLKLKLLLNLVSGSDF